jgi:hypothetical protein
MAGRKLPEVDAQPASPQYVVQARLLHDGQPCIPGDTVPGAMFTDAQAAYLSACGTLKLLEQPGQSVSSTTETQPTNTRAG